MSWLRALMLLALIVWVGGIIFFAFVLAPTLFSVLPTTQMAGDVVSPTLSKLHNIGLVAGAVFLLCSLLCNWWKYIQLRLFSATHIFIVLMLILTAFSQFGITPRVRELRARAQNANNPSAYAEFNVLHALSRDLEGGVLVSGLIVVVLTARRWERSN